MHSITVGALMLLLCAAPLSGKRPATIMQPDIIQGCLRITDIDTRDSRIQSLLTNSVPAVKAVLRNACDSPMTVNLGVTYFDLNDEKLGEGKEIVSLKGGQRLTLSHKPNLGPRARIHIKCSRITSVSVAQ